MSDDQVTRLHSKVAEIFNSKNQEWINAVSMVVDVLYEQFVRECRESKDDRRKLNRAA